MNVVLWVLQLAIALQAFAGGAYMVLMFDAIAQLPAMEALSRGGWSAVGFLEMACAILLVVPPPRSGCPA